ncbi:SPTB2 protein, partial [Climacteris rufus]|nr:SPTB2 protein [Climacteris rufus]
GLPRAPQVRLRSRDFGQHLSQVDDLLQIHALVEGDVAAQAERVRSVGAQAERFLGEGDGECPPKPATPKTGAPGTPRNSQTQGHLNPGTPKPVQAMGAFLWDAGEEEAWMREQERLLRCPELGRDLPGALRMLSQLEAIRGALGSRAGPLQQLLERGRELLAQGAPDGATEPMEAAGSPGGSTESTAGSVEPTLGATGSAELMESSAGSTEPGTRPTEAKGTAMGSADGPMESTPGSTGGRSGSTARPTERPEGSPERPEKSPEHPEGSLERPERSPERPEGPPGAPGGSPEPAAARRRELRDALGMFAARSEADACALWVGEREQWLLSMEIPERIEDLEVVQQRFETLEPELAALAARVASVGRVTQELQGSGERNRESARETWEQLRDRWERFRALAERKKAALTSALNIQNFRLECQETRGWMREKTAAIEATRALGRDLAGITALQGKLSGMGRDLDAIQGKLRELRAEGEKLSGEQPERAPEIAEGLAALEAEWDALRRGLRSRQESLGQARRLQGFLRDLAALQAWLSRTRAAAGSEDVPASLAEAEGSLRQHESLRTEISHYGADYRSARAAGREVTRGQADPQSLSLLQRLEALDADWEELGRLWEKRQRLLSQAVAFHVFLRDAKQVEGTLGKQEHALAHTEMPGTVPGAEAAVRRLEEFLAALDTGAERVQALTDTGRKLLDEGGVHTEKVRETVESVESRHQKIRESAQELLGRLRDNWELQKFLQDGQEVR